DVALPVGLQLVRLDPVDELLEAHSPLAHSHALLRSPRHGGSESEKDQDGEDARDDGQQHTFGQDAAPEPDPGDAEGGGNNSGEDAKKAIAVAYRLRRADKVSLGG